MAFDQRIPPLAVDASNRVLYGDRGVLASPEAHGKRWDTVTTVGHRSTHPRKCDSKLKTFDWAQNSNYCPCRRTIAHFGTLSVGLLRVPDALDALVLDDGRVITSSNARHIWKPLMLCRRCFLQQARLHD